MAVLLSSYFQRMDFNAATGDLIVYKMQMVSQSLVEDGTFTQSLLRTQIGGDDAMILIEVTKDSSSGKYKVVISNAVEQSPLYYLRAPFGYIDSENTSTANLHEMYFGQFASEATISMKRIVETSVGNPEVTGYIGESSMYGMMASVACIGDQDLRLGRKAPGIVVIEDRKLYLALDEYNTSGNNTYYNLIMQQED